MFSPLRAERESIFWQMMAAKKKPNGIPAYALRARGDDEEKAIVLSHGHSPFEKTEKEADPILFAGLPGEANGNRPAFAKLASARQASLT